MMQKPRKTRAQVVLAVFVLFAARTANADANIIVDGLPGDWVASPTCFDETQGDGVGNIDLVGMCIENNNSVGDVGSLFAIFENKSNSISEGLFGLIIDINADGRLDAADEFWQVNVPSGGVEPEIIYVRDPVSLTLKRQYNRGTCGGTATSDGWSARRDSKYVEMGIAYGCLGLSYGNDTRLIQAGVHVNQDLTYAAYYDGTANTLERAGPPANVALFTVVAGPGRNTLSWTNPPQHQGVVILRAVGAAVTAVPANQTTYAVGETVGDATVVYADGEGSTISATATFTDTAVAEPTEAGVATRYFYKVFNHHQTRTYAPGNVPTSNGLFGEPTRVTRPVGWEGAHWCMSTGFSSFVQPTGRGGVAVYGAGNFAAITGNNTVPGNLAADGNERFRPRQLSGPVQDRFTVTQSGGLIGIFTGDQSGRVTALSADTGATLWTANGGAPLASSIQSTPVFQARAWSSAAFQAAFSSDLLFVASRNPSATNNRVFGLRSDTGELLWTGPKNSAGALMAMDIASGAPWVEYDGTGINRLWVGSRTNGGSQPGLWVLDSLSGTAIKTFAMPAGIDLPVFRDNTLKQMIVVDNAGTVHGIDLATLAQVWSVSLGGEPASFPYAIGGGFIITRKGGAGVGQVARYRVTNNVPELLWAALVANPSYPTINFTPGQQRIYVGSSDGAVRAFDPATGAVTGTLNVSATQVGTPGLDTVSQRLHVSGADGRLCAFSIPFN